MRRGAAQMPQRSPDGGGEYTHAQYQIFELFRGHSEKLVTDRIPEAKLMSALRCAVARRDARGFDMSRQVADPSQLTDEDLGEIERLLKEMRK